MDFYPYCDSIEVSCNREGFNINGSISYTVKAVALFSTLQLLFGVRLVVIVNYTTMKRFIFFSLITCWAGQVFSQDVLQNKLYRVTAFRRGDTSVVSQSNYAEVIPPLRMYIPNAFTPNGDGINDQFGIKGEGVQDYEILVYDRWGEVIFESDSPLKQWDGSYKGQPVQQGTYVYQVFTQGTGKRSRTGSVTLIR